MSARPRLTERMEEALLCFGRGYTIPETAQLMAVTDRTAKDYCDRLRMAFGVKHKRELVVCSQRYFRR